jgi:hypothetical protein
MLAILFVVEFCLSLPSKIARYSGVDIGTMADDRQTVTTTTSVT